MKAPAIYRGSKAQFKLNGVSEGVYVLVTVDNQARRKSVWCESEGGVVDATIDIDEKMSLGACSLVLFRYEDDVLKQCRNYIDAFTVCYSNSLTNGKNSQLISLD